MDLAPEPPDITPSWTGHYWCWCKYKINQEKEPALMMSTLIHQLMNLILKAKLSIRSNHVDHVPLVNKPPNWVMKEEGRGPHSGRSKFALPLQWRQLRKYIILSYIQIIRTWRYWILIFLKHQCISTSNTIHEWYYNIIIILHEYLIDWLGHPAECHRWHDRHLGSLA